MNTSTEEQVKTKVSTKALVYISAALLFGGVVAAVIFMNSGTLKTSKKLPPSSTTTTTTNTPVTTTATANGIWISPAELVALPRTGPAYTTVNTVANGALGTANMADQDSTHPEKTMAVALVGVATNNQALKDKAVAAIVSAIGTENNIDPSAQCAPSGTVEERAALGARGLAVARNLIGYVIAADVLNLRPGGYDPNGQGANVQTWIQSVRTRHNCSNVGATASEPSISSDEPMYGGKCGSNGCSLALASRIAAAGYLGDTTDLNKGWDIFRKSAGDATSSVVIDSNSFSDTWRVNGSNASAFYSVNQLGTVIPNGYPVDGVIPNDQGRGGDAPTPIAFTVSTSGAIVDAISPTSFAGLTKPCTAPGNNTLTTTDASGLRVGMLVTGAGVPSQTYITAINTGTTPDTITVSKTVPAGSPSATFSKVAKSNDGVIWAGHDPFMIVKIVSIADDMATLTVSESIGTIASVAMKFLTAPGDTAYPWEGLQGMYASALMLERLGYRLGDLTPWEVGNNGMLRAVKYQGYLQGQFGGSWYANGRADWVKSLANSVYSYNPYPPIGTAVAGRTLDYTQWTHANYSPIPPASGGGLNCGADQGLPPCPQETQ